MTRTILRTTLAVLLAGAAFQTRAAPAAYAQPAPPRGRYRNFRAAIYLGIEATQRLADRAAFDREFDRVWRQVRFDKVYVEAYRARVFATDQQLDAVAGYFRARGVEVSGGIAPVAGGDQGQFATLDYANPADLRECRRAVELAARHFGEIVLDDFFFFSGRSDADIAARGSRSWTQFRLDTMRRVSRDCVVGPARRIRPGVRLVIKYPNWYEHFSALGYDLERQPRLFDAVYTGTETRDPILTDQLLQQYESYLAFRYFDNVRPGANLGGWVDTYATRYVDRYAEQLWDTLFARAPEVTLFNWDAMAERRALAPGERPWSRQRTSFDWTEMARAYRATGPDDPGPGWARAAGYSLEQVDSFLGELGRPVGVWSYRPPHATGEDYLHNYLGNLGVPIELSPSFPRQARTVLLTESASHDPRIVARIHAQLVAGGNVVITSGLLCALDGRGIERIAELDCTGRRVSVRDFYDGYGAGAGTPLSARAHDNPAVVFPEIRYHTNDAWPIVRGVAGARGVPIVLMSRYSRGVLYVLNVPENLADLYALPRPLVTQVVAYLFGDLQVRLDADPLVALFVYDNDTFIVQSFRDTPSDVNVSVAGQRRSLRDLVAGATLAAAQPSPQAAGPSASLQAPRVSFAVRLEPHSYRVFRITPSGG